MTDLLAARMQMALSLGFHIVFAAIGMAMPFLMAVAHWRWLRTGDDAWKELTRAWSKGVAIFFAIGAVSGTALSFELGLLWPEFMKHAGPIIGLPFSWEGTAFFLEAIALGLFLYGWDRLSPRMHWVSGLVVGISGVASAYFVICANAWMNAPTGFDWVDGQVLNVEPFKAMFNARSFDQAVHMILAAFVATGFAVAGVHASQLLRHPGHPLHERALLVALAIGSGAAILQPISGHHTAQQTAVHQPAKLAAAEALFETKRGAGLLIGGIPDEETQTVRFGFELPWLLSILAFNDPNAEVKGLDTVPREDWPPVLIVHAAYQTMIGIGTLLAALGSVTLFCLWRRRSVLTSRRFLILATALTPAGFLALEAGWVVTEVGRQPWIIQGIMRTKDALTPMPGLGYTLALYAMLYVTLAVMAAWLLIRHVRLVNKMQFSERRPP